MREIKFRAKTLIGNEWIESIGFSKDNLTSRESNYYFETDDGMKIVDSRTIGQYTGLKDVNGKDIFEGDLVEFHGNYTSLEKCGRGKIGVVTWDLDYMRFDLLHDELGHYDVATETDEWHYKREVIGNIHENKELLNNG